MFICMYVCTYIYIYIYIYIYLYAYLLCELGAAPKACRGGGPKWRRSSSAPGEGGDLVIYGIIITITTMITTIAMITIITIITRSARTYTPSPPTKSSPTKSPRVELSGRLPIKFNGHENSHPLELRVCLSQTL